MVLFACTLFFAGCSEGSLEEVGKPAESKKEKTKSEQLDDQIELDEYKIKLYAHVIELNQKVPEYHAELGEGRDDEVGERMSHDIQSI